MPITNLDFRTGGESLDLNPDTEVQFEINSPLFETDTLPGTLTWPFTVPNTPKNRRLLQFPGYLAAARQRNQVFACDLYLLGLLWKRGQLSVVRRSGEGFELSFQTDVGDVQRQLVDLQLVDVPMPIVPLVLSPTEPDYALPTVVNPLFVPEDDVATLGYANLMNAYIGGAYRSLQPVVPMPYLRPMVQAICAHIGYELAGTFFTDAEIQTLAVYSNQAVDPNINGQVVDFSRHLPDQSAVDFLKAWRALFCLSTVFDPVLKQLIVEPLRDILADARYVEWTDRAEPDFEWEPNTSAGFLLQQTLDGSDDLTKNAPAEEYELKIGGAQEVIEAAVGTLAMQRGDVGSSLLTNETLLPSTVQKGNLPALPDEKDNKCTFRVLFYRGLQPDAAGNLYPLASSETVNYAGTSVGSYSLRWAGPKGLYQVWHKEWLDFRARTELITRGVRLRMSDLMQLDPRRKVLIRTPEGTTLAFWKSISVTVSQVDGIRPAEIPFYKI